jgi:ABC-type multidrug transport system permease subunit
VFAWIGLIVSSPESANAYGFIVIFPLTFLSSAFVPPQTLPEPLRTFATDINPFSYMVDAGRALFLGTPAGDAIWVSIAWCLGLIAVFGVLAVARYRRAVAS